MENNQWPLTDWTPDDNDLSMDINGHFEHPLNLDVVSPSPFSEDTDPSLLLDFFSNSVNNNLPSCSSASSRSMINSETESPSFFSQSTGHHTLTGPSFFKPHPEQHFEQQTPSPKKAKLLNPNKPQNK